MSSSVWCISRLLDSPSAVAASNLAARRTHRLFLLGPLRATSQWYDADQNEKRRANRFVWTRCMPLERGGNDTATIAELVSTAVLRRHLETMLRLDIEYDFLPRESEILHLQFWDAAFALMKEKVFCTWKQKAKIPAAGSCAAPERAGADGENPDEEAKVIVRSNGTVTLCRQRHRLSSVEV